MYIAVYKLTPHYAPNRALIGHRLAFVSKEKLEIGDDFYWVNCPDYIDISNFDHWAYNPDSSQFFHVISVLKNKENRIPITIYE